MKRILFYGYLISYILQVSGPAFIDPILTTNVRYGVRTYPHALLTFPILVALVSAEFVILRWAKRTSELYLSLIPYSIAFVLTLPIFLPEFPHANVSFVYVSGLVLSTVTIAIQGNFKSLCLDSPPLQSNSGNQIEYLKEALSISKQTMVTLLAAYAGLVIAFYSRMLTLNQTAVTNPGEMFLMSMNTGFQFGWISIYFLIGPVYCAFQTSMQLLSQLKIIAQQGASADGKAAAEL
jgi:hypothetical protein